MALTFGSTDGILASDHSYKNVILPMSSALLLYRLSCMLYKVVLTFESVGEILKFNHSNESYWAVFFSGTVYHVVQGGSNFLSLWSFKRKILGCTFLWYCLLCRTKFKGKGSRFRACSFMKMFFFCGDMLYRLRKQYDHVKMMSKNQSARTLLSWQSLNQLMCK